MGNKNIDIPANSAVEYISKASELCDRLMILSGKVALASCGEIDLDQAMEDINLEVATLEIALSSMPELVYTFDGEGFAPLVNVFTGNGSTIYKNCEAIRARFYTLFIAEGDSLTETPNYTDLKDFLIDIGEEDPEEAKAKFPNLKKQIESYRTPLPGMQLFVEFNGVSDITNDNPIGGPAVKTSQIDYRTIISGETLKIHNIDYEQMREPIDEDELSELLEKAVFDFDKMLKSKKFKDLPSKIQDGIIEKRLNQINDTMHLEDFDMIFEPKRMYMHTEINGKNAVYQVKYEQESLFCDSASPIRVDLFKEVDRPEGTSTYDLDTGLCLVVSVGNLVIHGNKIDIVWLPLTDHEFFHAFQCKNVVY